MADALDEVPSHARAASAGRVKNKAPAKVQITAEQLLREAWERKEAGPSSVPKQHIADLEELQEYQRTERKQFEMRIVRNRGHTPLWIRYARWEEAQDEFARARSVWERAVDNDYRNPVVWLNYAEMEMRHRFVNHARNVLDRAVALLPRVDQLWIKYAHMEEMLQQQDLARLVYSRWLKWFPGESAFFAYIRFELRYGHVELARGVYEQLVQAHATAHSYIKYAKFEERQGEYGRARAVYERGAEVLKDGLLTAGFFVSFAKFEERRKQAPRARAIYQFALGKLPRAEVAEVERAFVTFEKQNGERDALDDLLLTKKRESLTATVAENTHDYDTWFDLLQLEESHSSAEQVRETYEKALTNTPLSATKPAWRRYIYLWIAYAVWAELSTDDPRAAAQVLSRCLSQIPHAHRKFSFGKVWVLHAQALVRAKDVSAARRALGTALGVLPLKESIYRAYIALETGLGELDRVRQLYMTWAKRDPTRGHVFTELARVEERLGETERAIAVLRVATGVPDLVGSADVWRELVRLAEGSEGMREVLEAWVRSGVAETEAWVVYAKYAGKEEDAREVFERAARALRTRLSRGEVGEEVGGALERVVDLWRKWEANAGGDMDRVEEYAPRKVRKRRRGEGGWEEYWTWEIESGKGSGKGGGKGLLLEAARRWKMGLQGSEG